jgi:predicted nucleic acid-binding protein
MILIDSSILVPVFRDKSGGRRDRFRRFLRGGDFALTRFTQIEILQGCSSQTQWEQLFDYLDGQSYVEMQPESWADAARIHIDLKRAGKTVRSLLDCCIAQIAIENRLTLIHNDRDFEAIAAARPLRQRKLDLQ